MFIIWWIVYAVVQTAFLLALDPAKTKWTERPYFWISLIVPPVATVIIIYSFYEAFIKK